MTRIALIACLLLALACHDLETGEPPTFTYSSSAVSVTALNDTQIAISWQPGEDDLLPAPELRYAIWFGEADPGVGDLEDSPDVTTREGALSWTLTGLTPETAYEVVVRAFDGALYSEVSDADLTSPLGATTTSTDDRELIVNTAGTIATPDHIVVGRVRDNDLEELGVISGSEISWYQLSSGQLDEESDIDLGVTITDALLVNAFSGKDTQDLVVVSGDQLIFRENNESGTFTESARLELPNEVSRGATSVTYGDNGIFDYIVLVDDSEIGRVYGLVDGDNDDLVWELRATRNLAGTNPRMRVAYLDGDGFPDMIYFEEQRLMVRLGEASTNEDTLAFDDPVEIAMIDRLDGSSTDEGPDFESDTITTLEVFDGNGDGDPDIYLYLRDVSQDATYLHRFVGDGMGGFGTPLVTDYQQAIFTSARFQVPQQDLGAPDFVCIQEGANNVSVYAAGNAAYANAVHYGYGDGASPDYGVLVKLNGNASAPRDLVIITGSNATVLDRLAAQR